MATKTSPLDDMIGLGGADAELDQAIDDLRGILKQDADVAGLDAAGDFSDTAFGGQSFSGQPMAGGLDDFAGGGDFAGGDFGAEFGGSALDEDDGASDFGATSKAPGSGMTSNLGLIMDIPIEVQIVLGSSRMLVSSLMNLSEGATIALDRKIGEPVEIVVNGRVIGRGEITVLEEDETRFGVRLIEIKGTKA